MDYCFFERDRSLAPFGSGPCPGFYRCSATALFAFVLITVSSFIALEPVNAAQSSIEFVHLSTDDGMSSNSVTSIVQDQKGFIWLGTQDGLNRYDGYEVKVYRPDPANPHSISNNSIWALFVDSRGDLWIGTYVGINRYSARTDTFETFQQLPDDPASLSHNNVSAIGEDAEGNLWVGTKGGGLNQFDRQSKQFVHHRHDPQDESSINDDLVNALYRDRTGRLWVGTNRGLCMYNQRSKKFVRLTDPAGDLSNTAIFSILEDHLGVMWFGTRDCGLITYDRRTDRFSQFLHDPAQINSLSGNTVRAIFEDRDHHLWIGVNSAGLNQFDRKKNRFTHYRHDPSLKKSLRGDRVYAILEDRSGVLWIGSYNGGISRLEPFNFNLTLHRSETIDGQKQYYTDIKAFLVDSRGALWVGSEINGLIATSLDNEARHYTHDPTDPTSLSSNEVFSIYEDSSKTIWIGSQDGWLNRYNPNRDNFTRFASQPPETPHPHHGKVRDILEDSQGVMWIGVDGGGLHTFDRQTGAFVHFHHDTSQPHGISNDRIFSIYEDQDNQLWIATFGGGLNRYDRQTKRFTHYRHDAKNLDSISYDYILCIYQDRDGFFWLGTDGGGLNRFDPASKAFKHYGKQQGLPNNTIYGILEDNRGYLWLSHNAGLSRFDRRLTTFKNYDKADGLQNNEFNGGAYYQSADGRMYFGGGDGFNAFLPTEIRDNTYLPPVVITDFQLFNRSVPIGLGEDNRLILRAAIGESDRLDLSYQDSVISFEFAGLSYVQPSRNQYAYILEGLESEWNYVDSRRFATYTTLPAGHYTLRVKASNNHGEWNTRGVALDLSISPPYWQTWWFRGSIVLFLILLIFTAYAWRMRNIKTQQRLLKELVHARTTELAKTKDALIEAAHRAGMAELATGVVHNVGNILTTVVTAASFLRDILADSTFHKFSKANTLLTKNFERIDDFIANDPRGKTLLRYYLDLEQLFETEHEKLDENVGRVIANVKAIEEAIATQQQYANSSFLVEELSLFEVVDNTLALQAVSAEWEHIRISKHYDTALPKMELQKGKLIQILTNLYQNAREAMTDTPAAKKHLTIEISRNAQFAHVSVTDAGRGLEKRDLTSIFAYGSSTKETGRGFGLHSSANYMTEMGGTIEARSEGPGRGATFVLSFPLDTVEKRPDQEK